MMIDILSYVVELVLVSSILSLTYLALRKTFHPTFNRFFLLGILVLAIVLPAVELGSLQIQSSEIAPIADGYISESFEPDVYFESSYTGMDEGDSSFDSMDVGDTKESVSTVNYIILFYLFIVAFLFLRFLNGLRKIWLIRKSSKRAESNGYDYYHVPTSKLSAASFGRSIFIGSLVSKEELGLVLQHEQIHIDKLHSVDILFSELATMVFWFNPVFWFLKTEIKFNSEYEVDSILASQMGAEPYQKFLLELNYKISNATLLNHFSAKTLKSRFLRINGPRSFHQWKSYFSLAVVFAMVFWLSACNEPFKEPAIVNFDGSIRDIKSITTRYESHKSDTHQKEGKIVAVAQFNPNGTIIRYDQHMTYPYNMEYPVEWKFWVEPKQDGLLLAMDGLSLEHAENNFIYGNDWPKYYAELPPLSDEFYTIEKEVQTGSNGLPSRIVNRNNTIARPFKSRSKFISSGYEDFQYMDSKVINHHGWLEYEESFLNSLPSSVVDGVARTTTTFNIEFEYVGENLVRAIGKKREMLIEYFEDQPISLKLLINGKMYTNRTYHYDDSGLKLRTEIFNVDGEPEYTIHYEYEFYSSVED